MTTERLLWPKYVFETHADDVVTLADLRSLVQDWPMRTVADAVEAALRAARPPYPEADIVPV
jgi:hypothetical protein